MLPVPDGIGNGFYLRSASIAIIDKTCPSKSENTPYTKAESAGMAGKNAIASAPSPPKTTKTITNVMAKIVLLFIGPPLALLTSLNNHTFFRLMHH